jgi:hypothetical protein
MNQPADQNYTVDNEVEDVLIDNINIGMNINADNIRATSIDVNLNTSAIRHGDNIRATSSKHKKNEVIQVKIMHQFANRYAS